MTKQKRNKAASSTDSNGAVLVLHGPNLNLLGTREPEIYGHTTLATIHKAMEARARAFGIRLESFQSNHEGELIDRVQSAREQDVRFIIINPAGYGIFTRPSLRVLYGVQHSNMHDAFGNSFVQTLNQFNQFRETGDRHWHHVVGRFTHGTNSWGPHRMDILVDGAVVAAQSVNGTPKPSHAPLCLGAYLGNSYFYAGLMDEVRLSRGARSDAWLQAT